MKKPCFGPFWVYFPNFGGKKYFPENAALSRTTSHWILAPCQNVEKIKYTIPRKHPDRRKDGRKDGQTLFYRTLPAIDGGPKSTFKKLETLYLID